MYLASFLQREQINLIILSLCKVYYLSHGWEVHPLMEHEFFHPANNPIIGVFSNSKFFNLDLTHKRVFVSQNLPS